MPANPLIYSAPALPLRMGVIGVGNMGQHHARILKVLPTVQFVGICDIHPERGITQARRYDVPYFQDYQALLPHVDAVCIAVPTPCHHEIGLDCLRSHCHVFIEKPIATSVAEAQSLLSTAQQTQRILQVGHIERFNPAFLTLQHHIGSQPIVQLAAERMSPQLERGQDVSVVMDLMIHDLDLMSVLAAAPVIAVKAQGNFLASGYLAAASATLRFANGITGTLIASKLSSSKRRWLSVQGTTIDIEANFLRREIQIRRLRQQDQTVCPDNPAGSNTAYLNTIETDTHDPLRAELEEFVKCICDRIPPSVGGKQALAALSLATLVENYITRNQAEQRIQKNMLAPITMT